MRRRLAASVGLDVAAGGWRVEPEFGAQQLELVAFDVADRDAAPAFGGAAADLRHRDIDEPLRSAQPAAVVAIARTQLPVTAALITATAAEGVALLGPTVGVLWSRRRSFQDERRETRSRVMSSSMISGVTAP